MPKEGPPPNILLIMPDQMRGDCMSLAGHPVLLTPNIDAIGGQGVTFTQAYTTCASCIPARRSLLTGQFPSTHGMVGYMGGIPLKAPTLPQCLRDGGYATAIVGRYMHQSPYTEPYGFERRILGSTYIQDDDYARMLDQAVPQLGGVRGLGLSFNGWQARPWPLPEYLHPTAWTVQQARQLIAQHDHGRPFFLTVSFYAPHPPLMPPTSYFERYIRQDIVPPAIGDWAEPPAHGGVGVGVDAHRTTLGGEALHSAQAGYFGLINHIDDQLYWLIQEFKALSVSTGRPWLIVFTSDHGEMLGDHYYFRKCEPYDGSSRIPFLIEGSPELALSKGLTVDTPVCLEDLMPTLLSAASLPIPETVEGLDLLPVLRGEGKLHRKWLHAEHAPCYSEDQAYHLLTDGREKYIWRPLNGREQLFNLETDPHELHDLARTPVTDAALRRWRRRLIQVLKNRAEGFTDGAHLLPGRPYPPLLPHVGDT